jgi:hypothetical protein
MLSPVCSIRKHLDGGELVALNVGPDGVMYMVVAHNPLDYRTTANGWATFAKTKPDPKQRYRVVGLRGDELVLEVAIKDEDFNIHDVQPLGGQLLLVCVRSQRRSPTDIDHNGRLYSGSGSLIREWVLGDGIESAQSTSRGELWTSYFDEGIFGNYGWTDPIGASGLVAWNASGEKLYEFEPHGNVGAISDCYALNVASDDDTWCYYYTDFPLVHLHKREIVSSWSVPVRGSHAFAVADAYALFAGAYDEPDAFRLVELHPGGRCTVRSTFKVRDATGRVLRPERIIGRGELIHFMSGDDLFRLNVRDARAHLSNASR